MVEWQAEVSDEKISIFDNSLCHDMCHFIWVGGSCPPIFPIGASTVLRYSSAYWC